MMPHWLAHVYFALTGAADESGRAYGFWSGFGGTVLFSAVILAPAFWWHHQCGVHGCYWYARRTTAAGERACFLHHPHRKRTVEGLHAAHHAAVRARESS